MTDAEYVFQNTSKERKRIGRGALAKKNGRKSKKCVLPSDHLTEAQKRKLNGEVMNYDLSKPMNWKQFKSMPHDLRAEYFTKLVKMGACRNDIADMFGIKASSLSAWLADNHKGEKFFQSADSSEKANGDSFIAWYCGETDQKEKSSTKDEGEKEEEEKTSRAFEEKTPELFILSGSIRYTGDPRAIFEKALLSLDPSKKYSVSISFQVEKDTQEAS